MCEVGDLSGKHGGFRGQTSVTAQYSDSNLPLFGVYTVVGRSIVLHASSGGARMACATLHDVRPMRTVTARFQG